MKYSIFVSEWGGDHVCKVALSGGQIKYLAGDPRLNIPLCDDDERKLVVQWYGTLTCVRSSSKNASRNCGVP